MTKRVTLNILTILSILYCFRLGYIWTPYGHGSKFLIGFHLPLIMLLTSMLFAFISTNAMKVKILFLGIGYFSIVAAFSLTIELIIAAKKDYFQFLYYQNGGYVDKIFLAWAGLGLVIFLNVCKQQKLVGFQKSKLNEED